MKVKLATYRPPGRGLAMPRIGAVTVLDGIEHLVHVALGYTQFLRQVEGEPLARELGMARVPEDMTRFLEGGKGTLDAARKAVAHVERQAADPSRRQQLERTGTLARVDQCQLFPPVPRPSKIVSVGLNYKEHAAEVASTGIPTPTYPVAFLKAPSSLVGQGAAIVRPPTTQELDHEVELCVVIGTRCKDVTRERALDFVAGYTIINDVSARDVQKRELNGRIGLTESKNYDTFGPCGPWILTADEVQGDPALDLTCRVNGDVRQRSNTRDMIFSVSEQIAYWSRLTLEPGDLITTGSPPGTALFRKDPAPFWLKPGDVVECEIERIGTLRNEVTAAPSAA